MHNLKDTTTPRRLFQLTWENIIDAPGTDASNGLPAVDPLFPGFGHGKSGDHHPHGQ